MTLSVAPTCSPSTAVATGLALDVRDLRVSLDAVGGAVHPVAGVSMSVPRGRTLAIVGESGCGKTVLSRAVMGILPRSLATISGQVLIDGVDVLGLPEPDLRQRLGKDIAMVFQDPMASLHPVMRVGSQITEVLRLHLGMSRKEAKAKAVELLASVKIPDPERRFHEYPYQLSGGMRQRVMIAIAIACNPKVLMADEPTTALDVTVQAQILDLLGEKQSERDMAMVLVSHDLGLVANRADEVAVMYAGKIVERAPVRALFANPTMPYTRALLASIPRPDRTRRGPLFTIAGRPPDLRTPPQGCRFAARCAFATEQCREAEPPLAADAGTRDHFVACWHPQSGPVEQDLVTNGGGR